MLAGAMRPWPAPRRSFRDGIMIGSDGGTLKLHEAVKIDNTIKARPAATRPNRSIHERLSGSGSTQGWIGLVTGSGDWVSWLPAISHERSLVPSRADTSATSPRRALSPFDRVD